MRRGGCAWLMLGAMVLAGWTVVASAAVVKQKTVVQQAAASVRIPLSSMGYQPLSQDFLLAGSSMLTVDFVDHDHLLVTFSVRRLMKRVPDDPANDEDRTIGAFVVELPSGKVMAKTEWRVHDRSRYLWNLGRGRFLLRVRDRLTLFAPMNAANAAEPFREIPLMENERHVVAVLISPEKDLLTVETTGFAMGSGESSGGYSIDPAPVQIDFYRLSDREAALDGLAVTPAGTIRTKTAVTLPISAAGRLEAKEDGKNGWLFNFDEHAGKVDELAGFVTTCFPRSTLVGHGEFVAFGCHGLNNALDLAGFNMKGEEMWQENFLDAQIAPTFEFAPMAGRFALGRTLVGGDFDPDGSLPPSVVTGQEVRVYQSYNGRVVFHIDCTPVERAGHNFALSEDGMSLAVVRQTTVRYAATKDYAAYAQQEAAVEVYALPALSGEDRAAVKEAQKLAPADTGARIDVALARDQGAAEAGGGNPATAPSVALDAGKDIPAAQGQQGNEAAAALAANGVRPASAGITVMEGDVQSTGPRKPPTLYAPGEKAPNKPQ
jgi:hypothetical protein